MMKPDDPDSKIANIPPFGLRMQPDLKRQVEEAAKENRRSLNAEIISRLEASFRKDVKPDALPKWIKQVKAGSDLEKRLEKIEARLAKLESH